VALVTVLLVLVERVVVTAGITPLGINIISLCATQH